ncbi:MAG: HEAT repeat domain-containing protein [Pirellulaceae bacterium]
MKWKRSRLWFVAAAAVGLVLGDGTILVAPARSATPESPEVRRMLDRAWAYLQTHPRDSVHATQLGGQALIGLAAYKYQRRFGRGEESLPTLTQQALIRVLRDTPKVYSPGTPPQVMHQHMYSLGLALVFLAEVQPYDHMAEINAYWTELQTNQKQNGSWGYSGIPRGDTSQLQYAALGAWSAKAVGADISPDSMRNLANYILRVQDPSGGWGYQGNDPGTFTRVPQDTVRPSLAAAGLGSLYVTVDFLGLSAPGAPRKRSQQKLPPALRPVSDVSGHSGNRGAAAGLEMDVVRQSMKDGNAWFDQNPSLRTDLYQYYFLYGYERYQSFREKFEGKYDEEPAWYNDGVRVLKELQGENGAWGMGMGVGGFSSTNGTDAPVSTAFAMLFLLRSAQETIEKVVERDGILRGGYDLPSDLTEVRLQGHRLVAPAITGEVADLIGMLENDAADNIESLVDSPDLLSLSGLTGEGREYTARLARVVRTGSFRARLIAVRVLGRQGELDNVPVLIYALTDPDPRVMQEALEGLRLTGRKFDGFDLPANPQKADIDALVGRWKSWYKSVRPEAGFLE